MPSPGRFIQISDCLNFRHLGGYRTDAGRVTRDDMLFRSGWFGLETAGDIQRFESCTIKKIFDFRTEPERLKRPLNMRLSAPPEVVQLPIDKGSMGPYIEQIARLAPTEVDCKSAMTRMYRGMLDEATPSFQRFFAELLRSNGPIMVVCSSGKDRTGVASALLLAALGVGKDTIFEDYLLSAAVYKGHEENFARRHGYDARGIAVELVRDVFTVHREYLEATWQRAEDMAGSMGEFLRDTLSLSDADLRDLESRFTK